MYRQHLSQWANHRRRSGKLLVELEVRVDPMDGILTT